MLKKLAFAGALLATFASTHAQSSQNFGVTGTVTPDACTVTLAGGGTVNVGNVSQGTAKLYSQVASTAATVYTFPSKTTPVNINCSAATKVALSFTDNKSGKNFILSDGSDAIRFGVTDGAGAAAVGFYSVAFVQTTMDSVPVGQFLGAANGSATFSTTQAAGVGYGINTSAPGRTVAFAKTAGATVPDALTTLAGTLQFDTYMSKPYIDAATTVVTPTGSGTLTLVYL